jgi:hypothetical protein
VKSDAVQKVLVGLGVPVGVYLIGRAIAEPLLIDLTDPATYRKDWGGPSLLGVLIVHCGPGVVAALVMARGFSSSAAATGRRSTGGTLCRAAARRVRSVGSGCELTLEPTHRPNLYPAAVSPGAFP